MSSQSAPDLAPDLKTPVPRGPLPVIPPPRPRNTVELTIDGQKSVVIRTEAKGRTCLVFVGMHPQLSFQVSTVFEREATDTSAACTHAVKFAKELTPNTK